MSATSLSAVPDESRHRWKVLGIGVAANASFSAAFWGIPATAVLMRADYRLSNAELGMVLGLLGLGVALSELPWGMLTDRWGDRRVLLTGLGATAAALASMALFVAPTASSLPGLRLLAGAMVVVGLLGGSVNGSSGRAVMAWFREGERGLAMSIRQTAVPVGGGIGAVLLPALAAHAGFGAVYAALALLCALTTLFSWRWLHEPPDGDVHVGSVVAGVGQELAPLRDARLWRLALGIGVLCTPQVAVLTFATVFLHDFGHVGVAAISACLAAVQFGAAVTRVWSGRWTDRRGNRRAYLRGCSLLTAGVFAALTVLVLLATRMPQWQAAITAAIVAVLVLGGICASAWHGVAYTELATLAGTRRAGTALGMGNTGTFLSLFLTPLAIPVLLAQWSWPAVWLAVGVCALLAHSAFSKPANAPSTGRG
ncbi:MFS transporter [Neisseriaceae bacterium JH1-16]|nr:MFS transporter [Neisseriaceae bacterium JH1-16]